MTSTKYTVRGTFAFVEEIVEQDSELFMGILDVDSFYTKIPNQETINICTNTLFENTERAEGLSKKEVNLSLPKNYILFWMENSTNKPMESLCVHR